jgi:hypothetical protein
MCMLSRAGNLYHHPRMSDLDQPSRQVTPSAPLYSVRGIIIATILGSLAAGVLMIAMNYLALGRASLAKSVGLSGVAIFLGFIGITLVLPQTLEIALLFTVAQAALAWFVADRLQGAAIDYHRERGQPMHSTARAALIGFLTGTTLFFLLILLTSIYLMITGQVPELPVQAPPAETPAPGI